MAMLVNGEYLADTLVEEELRRLSAVRKLAQENHAGSSDSDDLRLMAACAVVDRVLIQQAAEKDSRSVDPAAVEAELRGQMQQNNCRAGVNEAALRRIAEQTVRIRRTMEDLAGDFARPTQEEVMQFYNTFRDQFAQVEKAEAAHIIVHIGDQPGGHGRSETEARAWIEQARLELEHGVPFAEVAEKFSDCKGNGGLLEAFERGEMVEEFENIVFQLKPGQRSRIFRSPFGYHIAELRRVSTGKTREPGMAQREIEAYLTARRRQEAMERGLEVLRDQAVIQPLAEHGTAVR